MIAPSSSQRYRDYRRHLRVQTAESNGSASATENRRKVRGFGRLLWEFLRLLRGHGGAIGFALATLTLATLLRLVPPLATKLVVDNVLSDRSLPSWWVAYGLPTDRYELLYWVGGIVVVVSLLATAIHLSGRWYATKAVNKLQVAIRRRVFAHAVRLPLHRVYQLKSGGATSLLRDDAGGISELVFSMLYNPWRSIIQLSGASLCLPGWTGVLWQDFCSCCGVRAHRPGSPHSPAVSRYSLAAANGR
jgi:ATP-binding cassette subfamily B protein/subfamily B ATP-binding cassette protein MsbA